MKEVWKVFFKLKAEEIWDFIKGLPEVILGFLTIVYTAIVVISIFFLIGHGLIILTEPFNHFGIGNTIGFGMMLIIMIIIICIIFYAVIIAPIKWLRSNFKRAKEIIAKQNK